VNLSRTTHPDPKAWQKRAQDSWDAAVHLLSATPQHPYSGVSRLFYAIFQASKARLLFAGRINTDIPDNHLDYITYLAKYDQSLGLALSELFNWRLKADYCNDEVQINDANKLLANQLDVAQKLGLQRR
jgi:uncharacterized protein (UPF0332 family)